MKKDQTKSAVFPGILTLALRGTLAVAFLWSGSVDAQTIRTWSQNSAGSAWANGSNWTPSGTFAGQSGRTPGNGTPGGATDIMTTTADNGASNIGVNFGSSGGNGLGGSLTLGGIHFNKTNTTSLEIGSNATTAGVLQLNGATINSVSNTLVRVAGSANLAISPTVGSGTAALELRLGTTNGIFDVATDRTLTVNAVLSQASSNSGFTKTGEGTMILSGSNTFTGGVTVNAGTLQLGHASALNSAAPVSVAFGASSTGTLRLNGNSVTVSNLSSNVTPGAPIVENGASGSGTATLTVRNATASTFAGVLRNNASGSSVLALTKSGAGTLTLSGNSTYTGVTTVTAGTLLVNGSITSDTTVTGGTLGGSGVIDGNVVIASGGTLAPGSSPGLLTIEGNLSLSGTVEMEIVSEDLYDSVAVGGLLTFGGDLNIALDDEVASGEFILFAFANQGGSFASVMVGELALTLEDGVWSGADATRRFQFSEGTGALAIAAVPEPAEVAIAMAGLVLLAAGMKRRRQHSNARVR